MSTTAKVSCLPNCDLCKVGGLEVKAAIDGKTTFGAWAYMCEDCWKAFGIGKLGTGLGQRLELG